jgi:ferrous iron transport protein B
MGDCHATSTPVAAPPYAATGRRLVALIGPPNSGKSTLFNALTGLRQKVGNYPGVTVERHIGRAVLDHHRHVDLLDLPGVYSLHPRSEDEQVTHDVLDGRMPDLPRPDAVLLIVDSTNLARNLALVAPILTLGLPALVVLNMADELRTRGGWVDVDRLSAELGAPVALISAAQGEGIDRVREFLADRVAPPPRVELPVLQDPPACRKWAANAASAAAYSAPAPAAWTRRLDAWLLNRVWGPAILLVVLAGIWWTIFAAAQPMMDAVDTAVSVSGEWIRGAMPEGLLRSLVVDGIWSGVGSVVVFLPQILLLTLFMGLLEDSGYMARAALISDRTLSRVGLQGRAVIPLVSALACAIPAIMSTRTIENKRDRLATIFVAPFMVCSARLPVYTLLIAAFVPGPAWVKAATLFGLYVLGAVAAFVTAGLLKSTVLKSGRTPFVLEMPPYRWPTPRGLALRIYDRARIFVRRAGTVILTVAIVLWFLASMPMKDGQPPEIGDSWAGAIGKTIEPAIQPLGFNWKIGVGLISSLAAREVIIATLGTIYGIEGAEEGEGSEGNDSLRETIRQDLTPGSAAALIVFFAFALQCMSTVAVVRRETGGWKWPALQFFYMLALAYAGAFVAYRIFS